MANEKHVKKLQEGVDAWNKWRKENPDVEPDLSGIDLSRKKDFAGLIPQSTGNQPESRPLESINFNNTNLSGSELKGIAYNEVLFQGANLSGARLSNSTFFDCVFGITVTELDQKRDPSGKLPETEIPEFEKAACLLDQTEFYGCKIHRSNFCFCDLSTLKVDEGTRFDQVGVIQTKITQGVLQQLERFGGLSAGRRMEMQIEDDYAELRSLFSGFWNTIHLGALALFLGPYVWFLATQWHLAHFGENTETATESSPILLNLLRFLWSGGNNWQRWEVAFCAFTTFLFAILLNSFRVALLYKTKKLEHQQTVTGLYPVFQLQGKWKFLFDHYSKWMGYAGLSLIAIHVLLFLGKHVPLS